MQRDRAGCDAVKHGDYMAYTNYRCRCEDARTDWRRHKKQVQVGTFQPLRIDATGTRRRLQGLQALGWTYGEIGDQLGVIRGAVHQWAKRPQVRQSTADKVKALCVELETKPPPDTRAATRARNIARKCGWPPPAAWDAIDDPRSGHAPIQAAPLRKPAAPRRGQRKVTCLVPGCSKLYFRARLCRRHGVEYKHEIYECGYPGCGVATWRFEYCGHHRDIGLDFKAGDWYDWVAVDRMWEGRTPADRQPTVLELLELVHRAELADMPYVDLARMLGIAGARLEVWRYHAERLAATFEAAA